MAKDIMVVGDDGSVFHVDADDLGKIAKKVPAEKLSNDVKAHVTSNKPSHGSAYWFATSVDWFAATKADIHPSPSPAAAPSPTKGWFASSANWFAQGHGGK